MRDGNIAIPYFIIKNKKKEVYNMEMTAKIKVTPTKVLNNLIEMDQYDINVAIINQGYRLDKFIKHPNIGIRALLAKQNYRLDILINDKAKEVRCAVARQGYGLDILVNDSSDYVRYESS